MVYTPPHDGLGGNNWRDCAFLFGVGPTPKVTHPSTPRNPHVYGHGHCLRQKNTCGIYTLPPLPYSPDAHARPPLFPRKQNCLVFCCCPAPSDLLFVFFSRPFFFLPPEVVLSGRMVSAVSWVVERVRPVEKKRLRSARLGDGDGPGDQTAACFFFLYFLLFFLWRFSSLFLSLACSCFFLSGGGVGVGGGGGGVEGVVGRGDGNRRTIKACRRDATSGR